MADRRPVKTFIRTKTSMLIINLSLRRIVRPSLAALALITSSTFAATGTLRIGSYNIEADIDGVSTPRTGLYTALEAIGNASVLGNAQPLDILGLEETTSETTTVSPIVSNLNTYYAGSAVYATTGLQGKSSSNSVTGGNGPNSLIYNTKTLSLLQAVGVGTAGGSTNGEYRQITRYEFQPTNGTAADVFYVYVEHYKSGTTSDDGTDRGKEAAIVRADAATLGSTAHIIYSGDINVDPVEAAASGETTFTTLEAAGAGKAIDPLNNVGQGTKSSYTDSSTKLSYRDDYELLTQPMLTDTTGTTLIGGSYTIFGNNSGTLDSTKTGYLSTASDHLPVFADYSYVLSSVTAPEPIGLTTVGVMLLALRRKR